MMPEFKTTYTDYFGKEKTDVVTVIESEGMDGSDRLIVSAGYGGQGDTDGFMDTQSALALYRYLGKWLGLIGPVAGD